MPLFSQNMVAKLFEVDIRDIKNFEPLYQDEVFDEIISQIEIGMIDDKWKNPSTGEFTFIGNVERLQSFAYAIWGWMKRD